MKNIRELSENIEGIVTSSLGVLERPDPNPEMIDTANLGSDYDANGEEDGIDEESATREQRMDILKIAQISEKLRKAMNVNRAEYSIKESLKEVVDLAMGVLRSLKECVEGDDDSLDESISDGALDRLVDSMLWAPRVQQMLKRFGIGEEVLPELRMELVPALKMFFASKGARVAGVSQAKAAVRQMGRG